MFWKLNKKQEISYKFRPNDDYTGRIEMSGAKISAIIFFNSTRFWADLRFPAYLSEPQRQILQFLPDPVTRILIDGQETGLLSHIESISFDGLLHFQFKSFTNISVAVETFPSVDRGDWLVNYRIKNRTGKGVKVTLFLPETKSARIYNGEVELTAVCLNCSLENQPTVEIPAQKTGEFQLSYTLSPLTKKGSLDYEEELAKRKIYLAEVTRSAQLECPEPLIEYAYRYAKIRALEPIFETDLGKLHSPCGGAFYSGIWCNDQVEYVYPLLPFLGLQNDAAVNGYLLMAKYMKENGDLPHSVENLGTYIGPLDRGDEAMFAYGASAFCLALGDKSVAEQLLPFIEKTIEYEQSRMNKDGIVLSATDELEGRFPTGGEPLATSALFYGALIKTTFLEKALGRQKQAKEYRHQAKQLAINIDRYYGAEVEGFRTYRYFTGCDVLRGWICYPLAMGMMNRKDQTVKALLSEKLWTSQGLRVVSNDQTIWERETVYALRVIYQAGYPDLATEKFIEIIRNRLLYNYPPYLREVVDNGAHLSGESALLCRVITEGLFGLEPRFDRLIIAPKMPVNWNKMSLKNIACGGHKTDVEIIRKGKKQQIHCWVDGKLTVNKQFSKKFPVIEVKFNALLSPFTKGGNRGI